MLADLVLSEPNSRMQSKQKLLELEFTNIWSFLLRLHPRVWFRKNQICQHPLPPAFLIKHSNNARQYILNTAQHRIQWHRQWHLQRHHHYKHHASIQRILDKVRMNVFESCTNGSLKMHHWIHHAYSQCALCIRMVCFSMSSFLKHIHIHLHRKCVCAWEPCHN